MAIEARFFVQSVTENAGQPGGIVTLVAASRGPYKEWSQWTPQGQITMTVTVQASFDWYRAHKGKDIGVRMYDLDDENDYVGPHQEERA